MISNEDLKFVISDKAWLNSDVCKSWNWMRLWIVGYCMIDEKLFRVYSYDESGMIWYIKYINNLRYSTFNSDFFWQPHDNSKIPIPTETQMLDAIFADGGGLYCVRIYQDVDEWEIACVPDWLVKVPADMRLIYPTRYQAFFAAYKKVLGIE